MKHFSDFTKAERAQLSGAWGFDQARDFVYDLRKRVGAAWGWLTPDVHEALVAQAAFRIVRSQAKATVAVEDMDKLLLAMRVIAGLVDIEEALS